jgi:uncharacterized membrane protein YgaE (UPF0421/DUF939 family)
MNLMYYLQTEYNNIDDVSDIYEITESHHIDTKNSEVVYTNKKTITKKKKYYQSPNDIVYEAATIVEKSIIRKFKKYMNAKKITKRIESEYIYNFDELCHIIDTLTSFNGKHKVWFKEVPNMKNTWEVNFEELL